MSEGPWSSVTSTTVPIGVIVPVTITAALDNSLAGEPISDNRIGAAA